MTSHISVIPLIASILPHKWWKHVLLAYQTSMFQQKSFKVFLFVALFIQCCSTVCFSKDERIKKNYVWSQNYKRVFGRSWSWSTTDIERLPLFGLTLSEIPSSYNILQTSVNEWSCARSITLFCKLVDNMKYATFKPSASFAECKCHCQSSSKSRKTSSGQACKTFTLMSGKTLTFLSQSCVEE